MPPILLLSLILATAFPSMSKTAWMQPEAFRLEIGMKKEAALRQMKQLGIRETKSKEKKVTAFAYDDQRTVSLSFEKGRLQSIRFELVDFIPGVKNAFVDCEKQLEPRYGKPRQRIAGTVLIYDRKKPNVFVVASIDKTSESGKQGIGMLVVRYFDPEVTATAARF